MPKIICLSAAPLSFLVAILVGCDTPAERLVELSERSLARQAEQNQLVARQSTEVAQATHQLIEADAKSRQELIAAQTQLQQDLQSERLSLDHQHRDLEVERKQLATQRQRDPILAAAIVQAAMLVAGVLPLALCFFVLLVLRRETADEALGELLIQEFVDPQLLLEDGSQRSNSIQQLKPASAALPHNPAV